MKGGSPAVLVAVVVARRRHLWRRRQCLLVDMLSMRGWSTFEGVISRILRSRADTEDSTTEGQKDTRRTIFLIVQSMTGTYYEWNDATLGGS